MNKPLNRYRTSLGLLTDLYQITMAYSYWKSGMSDWTASFCLYFRRNPFQGGYALTCGLADAIDYVTRFTIDQSDIDYLKQLTGNNGTPLFEHEFLDYLATSKLRCDIDAMPEGTVAFPFEPIVRVTGPIIHCQLIETALLNAINFQTLIATKAARVCHAAQGDPVYEFGLRRAQGIDGGLSASRAAFIGGVDATSNLLAGKMFGIPVKGTHAHSWVMCFDDECEAFHKYAQAMPHNCVFLVDTYDTLRGVKNAIAVGRSLKEQGFVLGGIRLDSGDLAYLSIEARKLLDGAGFTHTKIVASNDLDERIIISLKSQGAVIDIWGVGTHLVTAHDNPALGGVYKLTAIKRPGADWQHKLKLSEQNVKTSTPGLLQVRRFSNTEGLVSDAIWDELTGIDTACSIVDPVDPTRRRKISGSVASDDLLVPVVRDGNTITPLPNAHQARERAMGELSRLHRGIRRFVNPHQYPVGLEQNLFSLKTNLVLATRGHMEKEDGCT